MMSLSLFTGTLALIPIVSRPTGSVVCQEVWNQSPGGFSWGYYMDFTALSRIWFELGTF